MAQFFRRYGKSAFFIGLLTIITVLSAWDYPGYFSKWLSVGLPLSILNAYLLYAAVYFIIYPSCRVGKSWMRNTVYITACALLSIGFTCLISRVAISNEELLTIHRGIHKSLGTQADPNVQVGSVTELIGGSIVTFFMFFGISWALVHWHRKKNLRIRFKKWRRHQSLSASGMQALYLLMGWLCWLFLTLSPLLISGKTIAWQTTILMLLPSMLFFYINLKTSFNLLANNQLLLALVVTLCWWGILLIFKALWFVFLTKGMGLPPILDGKNVYDAVTQKSGENIAYVTGKTIGMVLTASAFKELIILLGSFIYGYDRRITQYRKQMSAIAEARQQEQLKQKVMEKEVVDARLQSLKYQINPHFLFNSLNFLYSQSLPLSDELARATMLLSKMMRYGLQENSEEAKVSLAGEVEHLQNFIEFNQLRFSNQLQIDFKTEGQIAIRRIMPLLLITFVENAFKYGELHQPENPLEIHLTVDSQKLTFFVKNKKRKGPKEDSTGIGLENIRKRLTLGYPERHSLVIKDNEDFYATELTVVF